MDASDAPVAWERSWQRPRVYVSLSTAALIVVAASDEAGLRKQRALTDARAAANAHVSAITPSQQLVRARTSPTLLPAAINTFSACGHRVLTWVYDPESLATTQAGTCVMRRQRHRIVLGTIRPNRLWEAMLRYHTSVVWDI